MGSQGVPVEMFWRCILFSFKLLPPPFPTPAGDHKGRPYGSSDWRSQGSPQRIIRLVFPRVTTMDLPIGVPKGYRNESFDWRSQGPLHAGLGLHASFFDGGKESCMVAFGLVSVGLGKCGNGLVEYIPIT